MKLHSIFIHFTIHDVPRWPCTVYRLYVLTRLVWFMVFNTTFSNISVISWWSVLLVEETGVHGENYWSVASHWQTLSHNVVSSTPRHEQGFELTTLVVIRGTDCTGSCRLQNMHQNASGFNQISWIPSIALETRLDWRYWAENVFRSLIINHWDYSFHVIYCKCNGNAPYLRL